MELNFTKKREEYQYFGNLLKKSVFKSIGMQRKLIFLILHAFVNFKTYRVYSVPMMNHKFVKSTHNVFLSRWFDGGVTGRHETPAVVGGQHFDCAVKMLLQPVADVPEGRHFAPAGSQGART